MPWQKIEGPTLDLLHTSDNKPVTNDTSKAWGQLCKPFPKNE